MQSKRLSRGDARILRRCAVKHFKQRYPKYSGLNLSLREEILVVHCGQTDPIPPLIKKIPQIAREASIAIGISCVNLEINGEKIFSFNEESMVLLEDEVVSINGYRGLIDMEPPAPANEESYQPEAVPLITLSELSSRFACPQEDLLKALDHKNQVFFGKNKDQIAAIAQLSGNEIKLEAIEKALEPIELFIVLGTSNHCVRLDSIESVRLKLRVQSIPAMLRSLVEDLKKWNPDSINCVNEPPPAAVDVADTPKRRGRPRVAKAELEDSTPNPKRYQLPNDDKIKEKIKKSIVGNRLTSAAKTIVAALGDRGREFLNSAQELDDRYLSFVDAVVAPAVKEMGLTGKEAKEKKETLKSRLSDFFTEMVVSDDSSQEV